LFETHPSLPSPARFQDDFFLRQEIVARHEGRSVTFRAALEKQEDVLRLVGLTPYGSPAFMIEQSGDEVRFNEYVRLDVPFDPMNMLVDVHRILFEGSGVGARLGDGVHEFESATGAVVETWADGSIVSRVFLDMDSTTELSRIEFQGARDPASITSPLVILRDRARKYELEIRTVEQRPLGSAPPGKSAAGN
jgi:hypothetical protein